ncbi:MAG TPA: hypothetical protein VMV10_15645 [Pirellulales bacterium]|nr:hypothetical protein [Pirellulales bacterium]
MTERELRTYKEPPISGLVEIGGFKTRANWTESGTRIFRLESNNRQGRYEVPNALPESVRIEIEFDALSDDQIDALADALGESNEDDNSPMTVSLNGRRIDVLYLHEVLMNHDDTPRGLVFSNQLP